MKAESEMDWRVELPSTDSSASFSAAVKHLFRHLHEPQALRGNPLVQHFFESPAIGGLGQVGEQAVLDRIHQLVRLGAERCRRADLVAGKQERARRQYAIVTLRCLKQYPMPEVAAALGISYYHCYRERADICQRIARYICEYDDAPALDYFPELDEFRLRMDRARRAAPCDVNATFREFDNLIRVAPSAEQKIEALRASAIVSIDFGDIERAEAAYTVAQALRAEHLPAAPSPSGDLAQACIELLGCDLAYSRGNIGKALRMAQRATVRLEPLQATAPAHIRQLYVESLYALGAAFCNVGNLDRGYDYIASAEANLHYVRAASSRLHVRIMVTAWKLRNYLLMNSKIWYPS
jgi:hypothetical protein